MKTLLAACAVLLASATTHAADFELSKDCRQTIKSELEKRGLELTRVNSASYFSGGSDGASSWDSEYVVNAYVRDLRGNSIHALLSISDSYNCRLTAVNKAY